jgi:hypothetical protein
VALGPAIFDRDILALGKASRFQAQTERAQPDCVGIGRVAADKPENWQLRRLLSVRRKRPCRRRTEKADELAPSHQSITSSKSIPQDRPRQKQVNTKPLARLGDRADDNLVLVRGKALRADTLLGFASGPARDRRDFDLASRCKLLMTSVKK